MIHIPAGIRSLIRNPLVIGWLKDLTQGFGSGFAYAAILMILGALLALRLPIGGRVGLPATR